MWLVNIITAKTNIWSQMTSRRVDFVIQSRSNQKATSWKGFTLDKCTCMVKELHSEFKINNTTNICAFKLNVKVISTEQCSLFIRFMHVCMCMCVFVCQTHRLAAGNPVWRVHGVCKTLTALEKTRLFRRDWEHRPMLGIIVACSCRPPRPSLHRSWELTVCRRVRVREQRRDVFRPAAPVHRLSWQVTVNRKFPPRLQESCVTAVSSSSSDLDPSAVFTQSCWWTAGLQETLQRAEIPPVFHFNHA